MPYEGGGLCSREDPMKNLKEDNSRESTFHELNQINYSDPTSFFWQLTH